MGCIAKIVLGTEAFERRGASKGGPERHLLPHKDKNTHSCMHSQTDTDRHRQTDVDRQMQTDIQLTRQISRQTEK